ncbi:hypothetical protein SPONN_1811 [uncultured Candidatus Thioglobus sp.]|nr:hypothetical protein SPONN_1811 [uncultured Candidatus Thioglobus sp.]
MKLNPTYLNITLGMAIVVLSFYTIIWHNQNYKLYKASETIRTENQRIVTLNKQLLSEYSTKVSGEKIKEKALNMLKMKPVNKIIKIEL